jgi:hypothetical protein
LFDGAEQNVSLAAAKSGTGAILSHRPGFRKRFRSYPYDYKNLNP